MASWSGRSIDWMAFIRRRGGCDHHLRSRRRPEPRRPGRYRADTHGDKRAGTPGDQRRALRDRRVDRASADFRRCRHRAADDADHGPEEASGDAEDLLTDTAEEIKGELGSLPRGLEAEVTGPAGFPRTPSRFSMTSTAPCCWRPQPIARQLVPGSRPEQRPEEPRPDRCVQGRTRQRRGVTRSCPASALSIPSLRELSPLDRA
jgi:hypothetical protein